MADPTPQVINGKVPSWVSLEFSVIRDGQAEEIITPIQSLDYDDASSVTAAMGAGYYPLGVSEGQYVPGAMKMGLFARFARQWMSRVTGGGAVPLSSVKMRLVVKQRLRADSEIEVDEIDFHVTKIADSRKAGTGDPNVTTYDCLPILIKRNGVVV